MVFKEFWGYFGEKYDVKKVIITKRLILQQSLRLNLFTRKLKLEAPNQS